MQALRYSVHLSVVLRYFGQFSIILAVLTAVPLIVSLASASYYSSISFFVIGLTVFLVGFFLRRLPTPKTVQTNEAMVVVALLFLFAALIYVWPFMTAGLSFPEAVFEAISGVTTTGLTVVGNVEDKSLVYLFSRAWLQWFGGLGFVAFSLAVMLQPEFAVKRIGILDDYQEKVFPGAGTYTRRIFWVYVTITGVGILVMGLLGSGWLNGVLYTFAAVSTGGFSPHNSSISVLSTRLQVFIILLSVLGAMPLILYYRVFRKGWHSLINSRQIFGLLVSGVVVTVLLLFFLHFQDGFRWNEALLNGALVGFSAQTTAGFSTVDISQIDFGSKLVLIFAMFIGGSSGSTAGGIKILRLLIVVRVIYYLIQRTSLPSQAVAEASYHGKKLDSGEIHYVTAIILVFIALVSLSWLPFVVMGYDPLNSLFDVVSAVSTTGLSTGITSPELHPALKGILSLDMLMGRLEIFAWLVLFYPGSWLGRRLEE